MAGWWAIAACWHKAVSIPVEKGSKEATFIALAEEFGLDNSLFLGGPMVILEDFRCYIAYKKETDAFVKAESQGHHCGRQLADG